jgi:quercetin dioxygenase-like cupin family protein
MSRNCVVGLGLFVAGTVSGIAVSGALVAQPADQAPQTQMILRTDLQNLPGQEALVFTTNWAPGNRLPLHMHPGGHEFTFVLQGEQTFEIQGVGQKTVKAGEVLYTPPNVPHYGRNATDSPSKTVVFRIKDKAQPISVEVRN